MIMSEFSRKSLSVLAKKYFWRNVKIFRYCERSAVLTDAQFRRTLLLQASTKIWKSTIFLLTTLESVVTDRQCSKCWYHSTSLHNISFGHSFTSFKNVFTLDRGDIPCQNFVPPLEFGQAYLATIWLWSGIPARIWTHLLIILLGTCLLFFVSICSSTHD